VVVKKKEELESRSLSDLGKLCESIGIKGVKAKSERIERLLVKWQEEDGVEKGLAQMAQDERKEELTTMDTIVLRRLCEKAGVDFCVKEVMVERISKREHEMGRYARVVPKEGDASQDNNLDMVQALIANENNRKKEKELKSHQDEEAAKKKKELKSMSVEELKKTLEKKGLEVAAKKEDMVEALFKVIVEEQILAARKAELKKMGSAALKELLISKGLETAGSGRKADALVDAVLAHEAKCREELCAFEAKVGEVLAKKKEELEGKTNAALKDLCATKGLALGGGKEDRIERLLEEANRDGEVDKMVSKMMRSARQDQLMSMEKVDVLKLCEKMDLDPLTKDIMVERLLAYEGECEEPVTKKARM